MNKLCTKSTASHQYSSSMQSVTSGRLCIWLLIYNLHVQAIRFLSLELALRFLSNQKNCVRIGDAVGGTKIGVVLELRRY